MSSDFTDLDQQFSQIKDLFYRCQGTFKKESLDSNQTKTQLISLADSIWSSPIKIYTNSRGKFNLLTLLLSGSFIPWLLLNLTGTSLAEESSNYRLVFDLLWWLLYSDACPPDAITQLSLAFDQIDWNDQINICQLYNRITGDEAPFISLSSHQRLYLNRAWFRLDLTRLSILCVNSEHSYLGPTSYWSMFHLVISDPLNYFVTTTDSISASCRKMQSPIVSNLEHLFVNLNSYYQDGVYDMESQLIPLSQRPSYFLQPDKFRQQLGWLTLNDLIALYGRLIPPSIYTKNPLRPVIIQKIIELIPSITRAHWIVYSDYCANARLKSPLTDSSFDTLVNLAYGIPGNYRCYSFLDLSEALTSDGTSFFVPDYLPPEQRDDNYPLPFGLPDELGPQFNLSQAEGLRNLIKEHRLIISSRVKPRSPTSSDKSPLFHIQRATRSVDSFSQRLNQYIQMLRNQEYSLRQIKIKFDQLGAEDAVLVVNYLLALYRLAFRLRQIQTDQDIAPDLSLLRDIQADVSSYGAKFIQDLPAWDWYDKLLDQSLTEIVRGCTSRNYCLAGSSDVILSSLKHLMPLLISDDLDYLIPEWQEFTFGWQSIDLPRWTSQIESTGHRI